MSNMRPIGTPKCGTCKFMGELSGASWCQRNPPTPIVMNDGKGGTQTQSTFAPVDPGFCWCGEHQPKIHLAS